MRQMPAGSAQLLLLNAQLLLLGPQLLLLGASLFLLASTMPLVRMSPAYRPETPERSECPECTCGSSPQQGRNARALAEDSGQRCGGSTAVPAALLRASSASHFVVSQLTTCLTSDVRKWNY
jgi:hypothetical protein